MFRVAFILVLAFSTVAQAQSPGQDKHDKHIVKFRPGTSQAERAAAVQRAGGKLKFNYSIVDAVAITGSNPNVLAALQREPAVADIVPDRDIHAYQHADELEAKRKVAPVADSTPPGQVTPLGVQRVGIAKPGSDGSGIGVAIVDTGIDLGNADLSVASSAFSAFGSSCQDNNGHGTHVSGIVAAKDNSTGVKGVAPSATLYCVKVLDGQGNGSDSDVIAGLNWIAANASKVTPPIRVVNMSLGRDGTVNDNPTLHDAVKTLNDAGITVVVAAGNDASMEIKDQVPASYPEVLAVASTTAATGTNACRWLSGPIKADTASYFTTDGAGVAISAPGEDQENVGKSCFISSIGILSTRLGGGTTRMSGTSMASPHVAGIAARMIQLHSSWGSTDVRSSLQISAAGIGTAPLNSPTSSYTYDGQREGIAQAP